MKFAIRFTFAAYILSLTACSHGFHRETLVSNLAAESEYQVQVKENRGAVTAEEIKEAKARHPQLKIPFSLAIFDAEGCGTSMGSKDKFLDTAKALKESGKVSNLFYLSSMNMRGKDLHSARLAAAAQGADALFYYRCVSEEDRYLNGLSVFSLTLLGYWAFPGNSIDVLVILQGALVDVGNEYIYATTEAEAQANTWGPGATIEAKPAREKAKKQALELFSKQFVDEVGRLH